MIFARRRLPSVAVHIRDCLSEDTGQRAANEDWRCTMNEPRRTGRAAKLHGHRDFSYLETSYRRHHCISSDVVLSSALVRADGGTMFRLPTAHAIFAAGER